MPKMVTKSLSFSLAVIICGQGVTCANAETSESDICIVNSLRGSLGRRITENTHFGINRTLQEWSAQPRTSSTPLSQRIFSPGKAFSEHENDDAFKTFKSELIKSVRWRGKIPENFQIERNNRIVQAASAWLEVKGVDHEVVAEAGKLWLRILPGDETALNRYAKGIKKYSSALEARYDPMLQIKDRAIAAFQPPNKTQPPVIFLPELSILKSSPKDAGVAHETVHAKNFFDKQNGKLTPYQSDAKNIGFNPLPDSKLGQYDRVFGFDELQTYRINIRDWVKGFLNKVAASSDPNFIRESAFDVLDHLESVSGLSKQALALENNMRTMIASVARVQNADEAVISFEGQNKKLMGALKIETTNSNYDNAVFTVFGNNFGAGGSPGLKDAYVISMPLKKLDHTFTTEQRMQEIASNLNAIISATNQNEQSVTNVESLLFKYVKAKTEFERDEIKSELLRASRVQVMP